MKAYHLPEQIVSNVWLKKGYAWFANGKEVEDRNGKVHIGDDNDFFYDDADINSDIDSNLFEGKVWGSKGKQKYFYNLNWIHKLKWID